MVTIKIQSSENVIIRVCQPWHCQQYVKFVLDKINVHKRMLFRNIIYLDPYLHGTKQNMAEI